MIDALVYAVRDYVRSLNIGYGVRECEITDDDGHPPPRCGNWFVSVHRCESRAWDGYNDNNLAELYSFSLTLTARLGRVSLDRVGDQLIARNLVREPLGNREGFNAKVHQLAGLLHMCWPMTVLTGQSPNSANDNIAAWATGTVYGFVEPARFRGTAGQTQLVGGEWFSSEPDAEDFGLKQELRFEGAKRVQPHNLPVGPFA